MIFIGDVHGKWDEYEAIIQCTPQVTVQVGDFGLGMPGGGSPIMNDYKDNFIRGNHDNPETCWAHPNYLGDFGYHHPWKMFWAGGAWSTDRDGRTAGVDWWVNEELNQKQMCEAFDLYKENKPDIVVTHQAPHSIQCMLMGLRYDYPNSTGEFLDLLLEAAHRPKLWVFGHYHKSRDHVFDGVRFKALNELEVWEYDV